MKTSKGANRETPIKGQSCAKLRKSIKYDGEKFVETKYKGYFVSKSGHVLSFRTYEHSRYNDTNIDYAKEPRYVATYSNCRYMRLVVASPKRHKRVLVHRLIYETFKGRIPKGMQVDHIDGDKQNNALNNLQILTPEENIRKSNLGRISSKRKQILLKMGSKWYRFPNVISMLPFIDFSVIRRARNTTKFPNIPKRGRGYTIYFFSESPETIELHISATKSRKYD